MDQHIKAMRALGAQVEERFGVIHARAPEGMVGGDVFLDIVTVGGTINAMPCCLPRAGQHGHL